MLGCTPQACPASRRKEEPGVSDRDIDGLMDGGGYMPEARSWKYTPLCVADCGQDVAAVFVPGVAGGYQLQGLAHRLPGKPAEGHTRHRTFDKNHRGRGYSLKYDCFEGAEAQGRLSP